MGEPVRGGIQVWSYEGEVKVGRQVRNWDTGVGSKGRQLRSLEGDGKVKERRLKKAGWGESGQGIRLGKFGGSKERSLGIPIGGGRGGVPNAGWEGDLGASEEGPGVPEGKQCSPGTRPEARAALQEPRASRLGVLWSPRATAPGCAAHCADRWRWWPGLRRPEWRPTRGVGLRGRTGRRGCRRLRVWGGRWLRCAVDTRGAD